MYKLIGTNSVKRLEDGAFIPFCDGNMDYELYKLWLTEGNTPEPEFTDAEIAEQELNKKINEAKSYLQSTDWVIVKLQEAQIKGEDITILLTQYSVELQKRDEARLLINTLSI